MSLMRKVSLPESLFSADGVREIDRYIIDECGVPGFELMQKAARAGFRHLVRTWPAPGPILVLCGKGNNGGDGYLIAANAARHGLTVEVIAMADPGQLSGDAGTAWHTAESEGVRIRRWQDLTEADRAEAFNTSGLIVDAMLGTGVTGAPRAPFDDVIARVNQAPCPVLAVDVASGLNANRGVVDGVAVRADATVTFIALKTGLFTGQGPEYSGQVLFDDLDTAGQTAAMPVRPMARRADWESVRAQLPRRSRVAHKGAFGHVLIVAGDHGFGGAGLLVAEAASRCGAGLVTLATRPEHVAAALTRCPSVMVRGITHGNELDPLLEAADTLICGPGLGQQAWGQQMLQRVLASDLRRILDADALNLLAQQAPRRHDQQILTPHPGEAARLLGTTVAVVEADRLAAATGLQSKYGGVVLLKGAGTVVADGSDVPVVISGANPGMATGGMGDVLAGIAGALMAQLPAPAAAAVMAASLHLAAAARGSRCCGYMGLLPTDVIAALAGVLREAESGPRIADTGATWADD